MTGAVFAFLAASFRSVKWLISASRSYVTYYTYCSFFSFYSLIASMFMIVSDINDAVKHSQSHSTTKKMVYR